MKTLLHRIGTVELVSARNTDAIVELAKDNADHEKRLRKLEYLTAKVVGGAIVGSALGGWILSQIGTFIK